MKEAGFIKTNRTAHADLRLLLPPPCRSWLPPFRFPRCPCTTPPTQARERRQTKPIAEERKRGHAKFRCIWHQKAPLAPGSMKAEFAPWPETAHARPPDGNHGAWLRPWQMEATTAAVVPNRRSRWAPVSMANEGRNPENRPSDVGPVYIPREAPDIDHATPPNRTQHRR